MNLSSNSRPPATLKLSEGPQASDRAAPLVSPRNRCLQGGQANTEGPQLRGFSVGVTRYAAQFPGRPCRQNARNLFWFHNAEPFLNVAIEGPAIPVNRFADGIAKFVRPTCPLMANSRQLASGRDIRLRDVKRTSGTYRNVAGRAQLLGL